MTLWGKITKLKSAWPAQLIGICVYQSCFFMLWNNRQLKSHFCFKPCCTWRRCFTCISISSTEIFQISLRKL